jgi:hypothetical protein
MHCASSTPGKMNPILTAVAILVVLPALLAIQSTAGTPEAPELSEEFMEWLQKTPPQFRDQFAPLHPAPYPVAKSTGHYSAEDWAAAIDSVWGPGLPHSQQVSMWGYLWNIIDERFACFHGLDSAIWDSVWNRYYPEILDTVSRGRFCAILQHSRLQLHESHTDCRDSIVYYTEPTPGVPLFLTGAWGGDSHFGAALTPMPDSSLLVYKTIPSHPLGLVQGDLVLGYDGRPWKEIYPELLAAELPFGMGNNWGSSERSYTHSFLIGAGKNWHLFDSIDVVKYHAGDTVRLATAPLSAVSEQLWMTEGFTPPGISIPDYLSGDVTSWGIIDGSSIGFLISYGWFPRSDSASIVNDWLNAFDSMKNVHGVTGLIIEMRANWGTEFDYSDIFKYIFEDTTEVFGQDERVPGGGHFDMRQATGYWDGFMTTIRGDASTSWSKPIAVLVGPGAMSGGDVFQPLIACHPMAKLFGKPTAGAFNGVRWDYPYADWYNAVSLTSFYFIDSPGDYLTRKEFPSSYEFPWADYEHVWLTRDGVAEGRDDVIEAAMDWIVGFDIDQDGVFNEEDNCPDTYNPDQDPEACCCVAMRGNVDSDPDNIVDIGDLTALIGFLYIPPNPEPICLTEANIDGDLDRLVDIGDLTALISYLYIPPNPQPAPCP